MNLFTSSIMISLLMLTMPIMATTSNNYHSKMYLNYVKTTIACAFTISLIPTLMFIQSGQETTLANWHWITTLTMKMTL